MAILQFAPAETTAYMIAGYVIIFGSMIGYVISLRYRTQKYQQEQAALQELIEEDA